MERSLPLKSLFKLYSIPVLIVVVGICLYFIVFIEIKDKGVPHFQTHRQVSNHTPESQTTQSPLVAIDSHTQDTSMPHSQEPQDPVVAVEQPKPEIVFEPQEEIVSESPTQDTSLVVDATQELPSTPQVSQAPQSLPSSQPRYVYVNVRSANIRALPNIESEILHRANSGQQLVLIHALPQSEWSEVEIAPGVRGYIASYLLSDQAPQYDMYQVIVKSANIRALPSPEAPIIAAVGLDHNVRVLQNDGQWSKILLENGQEGYIASRLLRK